MFVTPEAGSPDFLCPDLEGPGGEQIQTRVRNYAGYGYLAASLASHGYAVVAPSANLVNNTQEASPDFGATPRAEIIPRFLASPLALLPLPCGRLTQ